MTVQFDILDYLTPEEIKDVCKDAIRHRVQDMFCTSGAEIDRLISNLGYEFIFRAVSAAIGEDAEKKVATKVTELLQKDDVIKYELWRKKDAWERTESPAIAILNEAILANKLLIYERVQQSIKDFEFCDVREAMFAAAEQVIRQKLFGGDQE